MAAATEEISDGRRRRGAQSRGAVLAEAVDLASLEGLDAVSFSRVAEAAGLSKAGVQGLFKTKEALQVATVDHAREVFIGAVIEPAERSARGIKRVRALVKHWLAYVEGPLFRGGCFRVANLAMFDSRTGPVHDALARDSRDWLAVLSREIRYAAKAGEIPPIDADRAAFEIDAVLCATNTALRFGDAKATARARKIVNGILEPGRGR